MTSLNFQSLLDTQVSTIEAPKPAPTGAYNTVVDSVAVETLEAKGDKKEAYLFKVVQKFAGIADEATFAPEDLAEAQEFVSGGKKTTQTFYVNADGEGLHRIKNFGINVLKIDGADSMTLSQLFEAFKGHSCITMMERKEVLSKTTGDMVVISEAKKNLAD